jgi:enamine deaminase RidA (YjgF/YER057c/UK114 family)
MPVVFNSGRILVMSANGMDYRSLKNVPAPRKFCQGSEDRARRVLNSTQMTREELLTQSGHSLPALPAPGGNYLSAKRVGSLVYLAGAISANGSGVMTGTVGLDRSVADGYSAARACALTQLAVLKRELGSLEAVAEVVSVNGYVNAVPGFEDSPVVINGASDLLVQVFGDAGKHVRAAVGVSALPRNAIVEIQMTVRMVEP